MGPETVNRNKDSNFYGPYAGRDMHNIDNSLNVENNFYITLFKDEEREFVVTHNANIKPVSYFTGRETELKDLRRRVEDGQKSVLVSGMGGIGKTHICRKLFGEYWTKHADGEDGPFKHIGYIEYSGDMGGSLQNCLKYKEQEDPQLNREAAWRELEYLASDGKLLLFVDNVDKPMREDLGLQRLNSIPGAIVLTSRQTSFSDEFEPYRIGFLSIEQCKEIYEKIRFEGSGGKVKPEEEQDLIYIIETLAGRHTITVEFLAHLARTKLWTVKRLRDELEQKGFRLQFRKNGELINIQESYEKLYDLSKLTEAEQNILEAFSIFPYIPLSAEICNQWLLADAGVDEDYDILTGLYQKGWLQFDWEQESYAMHPVFAQFIYDKCKPKTEKHVGLIEACQDSLEVPESGFALACQKYIPFAENIVEKVCMEKCMDQVGIISMLCYLFYYIGEYEQARKLYEKRLEDFNNILNENSYDALIIYNNLAEIYEKQGEYEKSKELHKKSLNICEIVFGEEHSYTATIYNNLAIMYGRQGEYEMAEELFKKSLRIREKVLTETHPDTASSYNNLAYVYEKQGEYEKAEELVKKSLRIHEEVLGENHPYTAITYNNLANIYERQGEYERAEELYEKSLRVHERALGENHPNTANSYNGLAYMYEKQGEYEKAEELYKRSLRIREEVLGKNHLDTADIYNNLAKMYEKQGEHERAEELFKKGLRIREGVLGENHLDTADIYSSLARIYMRRDEYERAEELYEKSLRVHERALGENHPDTATSYNNIAHIYVTQGEYEKAVVYYLKAYKIFLFKLGLDHPNAQLVYKNMEIAYSVFISDGNFEQWLEEKLKEGE